jgi:hypothetical protein
MRSRNCCPPPLQTIVQVAGGEWVGALAAGDAGADDLIVLTHREAYKGKKARAAAPVGRGGKAWLPEVLTRACLLQELEWWSDLEVDLS